jgi:hypothetical protein
MTEESHIPMTPFDARPLSDDYSPPTYSTSGLTTLNMMPQETHEAARRHNEGEYLGAPYRYTKCYLITS